MFLEAESSIILIKARTVLTQSRHTMAGQQPASLLANLKLSFPLAPKAINALHAFASGSLLHLHLVICDEAVVLKKDEEDCPLLGTILDLQNVATESRLLLGDDTC